MPKTSRVSYQPQVLVDIRAPPAISSDSESDSHPPIAASDDNRSPPPSILPASPIDLLNPSNSSVDEPAGIVFRLLIFVDNAIAAEVRFDYRVDQIQLPKHITDSNDNEECKWGSYAKGALYALQRGGNHLKQVGIAYLLALESANNLNISPTENIEYDRLIENEFLGLKNGILDQSTVLLSSYGCLTFMDCKVLTVSGDKTANIWTISEDFNETVSKTLLSHLGTYQVAKWNGTKVSLKILDKDSYSDPKSINAFKHELTLLEKVKHPNVVQFVGAVTQNIPMMIVSEYHARGGLTSYLQKKGRLSPSKAVRFALDIGRKKRMHAASIIVLLDSNFHHAVLETVARVKSKKNDTKDDKTFQLHHVFTMDNDNRAEERPTLIDRKDNIFIISNFKSKYPMLQLDLRLISDVVVVIVSTTCGGIAFAYAGQPVITGYFLAGSVVGPGGLDVVSELVQVETVAQFGVIFLLFALGLEFSMVKEYFLL
ncbi:hypothetical protein L2E82_00281 [Cichorium intybus]|uniref:Uncharacterized protein n=1 Tax=Cichorium intybus TaxID=13427 RepID=A0ACB9GXQ9_CICIN|nr:hypothetical protein L2E82_00281 [Cichorium intybus]